MYSFFLPYHVFAENNVLFHVVSDFQHDFFKRYGRKNGFICFVLRYFLVLNVDRNLNLNMGEFMAVLAVAFGKVDPSWYQGLALCPNARCVTVGNWFQVCSVNLENIV